MQIGMIGLGRMGANIVRRLLRHGHTAVVFDHSAAAVDGMRSEVVIAASNLNDFVEKLDRQRVAWIMLPAGEATERVIQQLSLLLNPGDVARPNLGVRRSTMSTSAHRGEFGAWTAGIA